MSDPTSGTAPDPVDLNELTAPPEWLKLGRDQQSWERLPGIGRGIFRAKMTPQGQAGPRKPAGVSDAAWYGTDDTGRQQILNNVQSHGSTNAGGTPAHDAEQPGLLNDLYSGVKSALHNTFGGGAQYSEEGGGIKETHPQPQAQEQAAPPPDQPTGDSGGGEQQQKPSYAQQLGQYVQAHEVAGVDPERQAGLEQAYKDEINARLSAGDIASRGQEVYGQGLENAANQEMADNQRVTENETARQEYLDRLGADIESDAKDLSNAHIDPERFWKSRSTPQAIAGVLSMALGGFLQGFKGGRNPAADQIQSMIELDVKSQVEDLGNKWNSLRMRHSLLADKAARYSSLEIAERQQIAARLQGVVLMAQAAAARTTSPIEKANALALASQLEQKAIESGIAMNKWVSAGYVGGAVPGAMTKDLKGSQLVNVDGQWVDAGDEISARNITTQNQAADHIMDQASRLIDLLKDNETLNPWSRKRGDMITLSKMISQDDIKDAGGGRAGLGYMKFLQDAQGKINSSLAMSNPISRAQAVESLNQFIHKAQADKAARLNSLAGSAVVERVVDPTKQRVGLRVIGQYEPSQKPVSGGVAGYKPAGQ